MVSKYWALYTDEIDGFSRRRDGGRHRVAGEPQLRGAEAPVDEVVPTEGVTGWADTWMISANAPHPNCMLKWMEYTMRPDVQAQVADCYGAAGSNVKSCDDLAALLGKKYADLRRHRSVLLLRQRGLPELDLPVEDAAGELR